MQIRIESLKVEAGSDLYDLVLVQGEQQIRLGLTAPNAMLAAADLAMWMENNTIDIWEIVRAKESPKRTGKQVAA